MNKKFFTFLIGLTVLISLIAFFLLSPLSSVRKEEKDEVINIALAGPMSGDNKENGDAMLRGVKLALDKTEREGKLKNKKIQLLVYDDINTNTAVKIASDIANENKAMLVLGHYSSDNSIIAGTIYKKSGIPAITASATADDIVNGNEWYLRTIPGNSYMIKFIINYMKKEMSMTSASIIYSKDKYGSSLSELFESEGKKLGIDIKNKWGFDRDSRTFEEDIRTIIGQLRSAKDRGIIFCATGAAEAAMIFSSLKYPGTDYIFIGPSSLSTSSFIANMNNYKHEKMSPGYFSDMIMSISPFIPNLAIEKESYKSFMKDFIRKYKTEPSGLAACYYDATLVAVKALEMSGIKGQNIRDDRLKVRDALHRINKEELAVRGVTGDIFFNEIGDVNRPLDVGIWNKQIFLPIPVQYQDIHGSYEDVMKIDNSVMKRVKVVYTAIDINEISNLNAENGTFTADFYLWFFCTNDFDHTNIEFINSVNPIRLGKPIAEKKISNDLGVKTYRVIADFRTDSNSYAYPFDSRTLRISFRHAEKTRADIMYISDVLGLSDKNGNNHIEKNIIRYIPGWNVNNISLYQDIMNIPDLNKKISVYSRFNAAIEIQRKQPYAAFLTIFFPVFSIIIILYLVYFVPPDQSAIRLAILLIMLPISILAQYIYSEISPIWGGMRYLFYTIYGLGGITAVISVFINQSFRNGKNDAVKILTRVGKIVYPLIFLIITAVLLLR